jgi:hypothetical protein
VAFIKLSLIELAQEEIKQLASDEFQKSKKFLDQLNYLIFKED